MSDVHVAEYDLTAEDREAYYAFGRQSCRKRRRVSLAFAAVVGGPLVLGSVFTIMWPAYLLRTWHFALPVVLGGAAWWAGQALLDVRNARKWNRSWPLGHCKATFSEVGFECEWPPGQQEAMPWSKVEYVVPTPTHLWIKGWTRSFWIPTRGFSSAAAYDEAWTSLEKWALAAQVAEAQRSTAIADAV